MADEITAGVSGTDAGDERADTIRFVTRDVSDEEAAAVTAVVLAALDDAAGAPVAEPARDPWVRSAGSLRAPFPVGPGRWARSTR